MTINWNRRKYTQEEFISAWINSSSIAQCIKKLKLNIYGSTYITVKSTASELGLNTNHMTGSGWNVGDKAGLSKGNTIPLEKILVENSTYLNTMSLKSRLIKSGHFKRFCSKCGLDKWLELGIPLELDHINGVRSDNRIENLRLLCPNCHAQTDTYCGKNMKKNQA